MAKALYPLVEIEWTDAYSPRDKTWWESSDIPALIAAVSAPDHACGYRIYDGEEGVLLAGQVGSTGYFGDVFFIPRGMINKQRILREAMHA